jgi:hypothetical protein
MRPSRSPTLNGADAGPGARPVGVIAAPIAGWIRNHLLLTGICLLSRIPLRFVRTPKRVDEPASG